MGYMKRFATEVSEAMGENGRITDEVMAAGQRILDSGPAVPVLPMRRKLDATEMEYLHALPSDERLLALLRCALGAKVVDSAKRIEPSRVYIPAAQLTELAGDDLYWEKYGPSAMADVMAG